jgi:hypothetical protein
MATPLRTHDERQTRNGLQNEGAVEPPSQVGWNGKRHRVPVAGTWLNLFRAAAFEAAVQLTPAMVREHGGRVCPEPVIHMCRVCCFLNRLLVDEIRIRLDKDPIHGKRVVQ